MRDDEWLDHGPASIGLLLERQNQRDNLHKLCAGVIASMWMKDGSPEKIFPELIPPKTPEELKEEAREKFRLQTETIKRAAERNARKQRRLEDKRTKGT